MNADAFRHLYNYHFGINRLIWNQFITQLTPEQFVQHAPYSHGSVRDQIIHMMQVDETWFNELRILPPTEPFPHADIDDRETLRTTWDEIEQGMRRYLAGLHDTMVSTRPIQEPDEDRNLIVWQVLFHVLNHGTDHRAQLLQLLNNYGFDTTAQDYIYYAYHVPA